MTTDIATDTAQVPEGSPAPEPEAASPAESESLAAAAEPAVDSEAPANGAEPDSPPASDATPPEARKPKADRIKELIAERNFWRERAVAGNPAKPAAPETPPEPEGPPTLEQFEHDADAWAKAFAAYHDKRAAQLVDQHLARVREQEQQQQVAATFASREEQFAAATPDYAEAVSDPSLQQYVTPTISEAVVHSEVGPQLSYYLATHREELATIARMRPTQQAIALGKLEVKLSSAPPPSAPKPKPVQQTRAPAPPSPIGKGKAPSKRPEDMPMDEYMEYRRSWAGYTNGGGK